jgi:DNA-3-methyladenine glycosylase II
VRLDGPHARTFEPEHLVARALGTGVRLSAFERGARRVPWLDRIARAARGVKPPRYTSLWETACNAIVYQQISIHAAGAILRRVIERYAPARTVDEVTLAPFPPFARILGASDDELRALGLSTNKVRALKAIATAIATGALDESVLEPLPTADLLVQLTAHPGIGPWTAAVIALRGFGRLDVFPMKDSGATALLRRLSGDPQIQDEPVIEALAPQQGMLYYHLLLGRLAATGEVTLAR